MRRSCRNTWHILTYTGITIFLFFIIFNNPLNASSPDPFQSISIENTDFSCGKEYCVTASIGLSGVFNTLIVEREKATPLQIRFFDNERWLDWVDVQGEDDSPDFETHRFETQLFMLKGTRAFQLKKTITAINETGMLHILYSFTQSSHIAQKKHIYRSVLNETPDSIVITSRGQWLDWPLELVQEDRERLWKTEYDSVKKIIVHHTATVVEDINKDGVVNTLDYRDSIRAIYNYHTRGRKWGDIGYNYIIDPDGGIWEGRYGGDGVVAGHSFRDKACTKFGVSNTAFNRGTIGIALLGTYTSSTPTPAALESLSTLIAKKSWDFGFEPSGSGFFIDKVYSNILTHRDVDCTDCPGDAAYGTLPGVITRAQEKYSHLDNATPKEYRAAFIDQQPTEIEMKAGEEKEIVVRFRNTGTATWRNYGEGSMQLALSDIKQSLTAIDSFHIAADEARDAPEKYIIPSKSLTPNVLPGDIGSFSLTIKDLPQTLISYKKFVMVAGHQGWIPQSDFAVKVINTSLDFAATLRKETAPLTLVDEMGTPLTFQFRNRGVLPWKREDIRLSLSDADGNPSSLRDTLWKKKTGDFFFKEKIVKPGEYATFSFPVYAKGLGDAWVLPGLFHGKELLSGSNYEPVILIVKPAYAADIISVDIPSSLESGKKGRATITIKNIGEKPWPRAGLNVYNQKGKMSVIRHSSWLSATLVDQARNVKPGDTISFLFDTKAPQKAGVYTGKIQLEHQKLPMYLKKDGEYSKELLYNITVNKVVPPVKKVSRKK